MSMFVFFVFNSGIYQGKSISRIPCQFGIGVDYLSGMIITYHLKRHFPYLAKNTEHGLALT